MTDALINFPHPYLDIEIDAIFFVRITIIFRSQKKDLSLKVRAKWAGKK